MLELTILGAFSLMLCASIAKIISDYRNDKRWNDPAAVAKRAYLARREG